MATGRKIVNGKFTERIANSAASFERRNGQWTRLVRFIHDPLCRGAGLGAYR